MLPLLNQIVITALFCSNPRTAYMPNTVAIATSVAETTPFTICMALCRNDVVLLQKDAAAPGLLSLLTTTRDELHCSTPVIEKHVNKVSMHVIDGAAVAACLGFRSCCCCWSSP